MSKEWVEALGGKQPTIIDAKGDVIKQPEVWAEFHDPYTDLSVWILWGDVNAMRVAPHLNGTKNPEHPTTVHLRSGEQFLVKETPEEIFDKVQEIAGFFLSPFGFKDSLPADFVPLSKRYPEHFPKKESDGSSDDT